MTAAPKCTAGQRPRYKTLKGCPFAVGHRVRFTAEARRKLPCAKRDFRWHRVLSMSKNAGPGKPGVSRVIVLIDDYDYMMVTGGWINVDWLEGERMVEYL